VDWLTVGKTGNECVSTSTDGKLHWWDKTNNEDCPIESFTIKEKIKS